MDQLRLMEILNLKEELIALLIKKMLINSFRNREKNLEIVKKHQEVVNNRF
jgi:hypothetical protein